MLERGVFSGTYSTCNTFSAVFSLFVFPSVVLRQRLLHLAAACLSNVSNCCVNCCVVGTTECYSLIHRTACVEKSVGQE